MAAQSWPPRGFQVSHHNVGFRGVQGTPPWHPNSFDFMQYVGAPSHPWGVGAPPPGEILDHLLHQRCISGQCVAGTPPISAKYEGVKEFHMLARIGCYSKVMDL